MQPHAGRESSKRDQSVNAFKLRATHRWLAICVSSFALWLACERATRNSNVDERKLLLLVETISTQKGWLLTGATEERLQQLQNDAVWDVEGTVRMLEAARSLQPAELEAALQSGVQELQHITLDAIAARIQHVSKRLGNGGPCTAAPATADDTRRAAERLRALKIPAGLSNPLRERIEHLSLRAAAVAKGPFHRASCEGPAPILFGWLDGKPVPLIDLIDEEE
jgi:hypothetical protein